MSDLKQLSSYILVILLTTPLFFSQFSVKNYQANLYSVSLFELIHSDIMKSVRGKTINFGNVEYRHIYYGIKCDSSEVNKEHERYLLFNATMWDTTRYVTCDRAEIYRKSSDESRAYLRGNVRIDQDSIRITSKRATFVQQFSSLTVSDSVIIKYWPYPTRLKSKKIIFDDDNKEITASSVKIVEYIDSTRKIDLYSNKIKFNTKINKLDLMNKFKIFIRPLSKIIDNFEIVKNKKKNFDSLFTKKIDSKGEYFDLFGNRAEYFIEDEKINIFKNCKFVYTDSTSERNITTLLADTIKFQLKDGIVEFFGNVNLTRDSLVSNCNYAKYFIDDKYLKMNKEPILSMGEDFIKGDSIRIDFSTKSQFADKITVVGNSSMKRIPDRNFPQEKNSMIGKMMEIFFDGKDLSKVRISGEATSVYFIEEEKKKIEVETEIKKKQTQSNSVAANFLTGDTIIVNFSRNNIDKKIDKMDIEIIGGCEGIYYPGKLKKNVLSKDK